MILLLLPFMISLLTILFFHPSLRQIFEFRSKGSKLPPGSFGWCPLIGDTLSFSASHRDSSLGPFINKSMQRYGKIFKAHLFGHPTVVSCDPEFNYYILQNEGILFHSTYPKTIPGVLGDLTMLVATGDTHKRLRGYAVNLFSSIRTPSSSFLSDIEDNVLRVMNSWKHKKTVQFLTEARKYTFGAIVKQTLSLEFEDPDVIEMFRNFGMLMKGIVSLPINLPGTSYAKAIRARQQIEKKVMQIRRQRDNGGRNDGTIDFLDVLTTQEGISEEEITSLVMDLLYAGYEMSSLLIAVIVKYLGENSNSKILSELREEHHSVMRTKNVNGRLGLEDYEKMQFTKCVINEALRLGNLVKGVHRKAIKPIQYKGYEIPAEWRVIPIFSSGHLDPSFYPDPLMFDPHRWQDVNVANSKTFMPFCGGKRLCLGPHLVMLETSFFIHHLILNYSWTPMMELDWPVRHPHLDFEHGLQIAIEPLPLAA